MESRKQQERIRKSLNDAMRRNAEAETKFQNSWRKKLEKKLGLKP